MKILQKILVLLAVMMPLGAESLPVVTLDEAIASAEENNITLKQLAVSLNQTIRNENNYVADYLPTFGLSAKADTGLTFPNDGPLTAADKTEFDGVGLDLSAFANFSYTLDGSKITDGASRRLNKEAATLSYESNRDDIVLGVTSAYWTLATYDIAVENAQAALSDAEATYESTLEMYNSGMADELSMSQVELALSNAYITLSQAENDKALALASFKAMTGLTEDFQTEPLPETVELALPQPSVLFDEYAEATSAIRIARNELAAARNAEKTMTLSQYMPTVDVAVGYTYNGGIDTDAKQYSTNAHSLSGSVTVSIPLSSYIPGSTADEYRMNAKDTVTLSSLSLQSTQNDLMDTIRENSMAISQQQRTLDMLSESLGIAERTYALAEESYEAGLITANNLAERRTELLQARNSLLSARLSHLLSSYTLANTLGIELQDLQAEYPVTEKETV